MFNYKIFINPRVLLFLFVIGLATLFFYINTKIINQFRYELNKQIKTVLNVYHEKVVSSDDNSDYLLEVLLPLIKELDIPVIIKTQLSDGSFSYEHLNIDIKYSKNTLEYNQFVENTIATMDQNFAPLTIIEYDNIPLIQIHYGDTNLINIIKWIPYIELLFAIILLALIIMSYRFLNISEKNLIYVGMAKETAHQLGTPISSLMGWVDLLKDKSRNRSEIISNLENEIDHLKKISNKFNKIGSIPKLSKINLNKILEDLVKYYKVRIPKSKKIDINILIDNIHYINGDSILLYWSFENLIKNSIESIKGNKGLINIQVNDIDNKIHIIINDDGIGITTKNKNKIFKPGYSTKSRGWGLGLSLSKRIINDIHEGSIKLLKSNKDETSFLIILKSFYS
jgi:signal transduction histidine kinase